MAKITKKKLRAPSKQANPPARTVMERSAPAVASHAYAISADIKGAATRADQKKSKGSKKSAKKSGGKKPAKAQAAAEAPKAETPPAEANKAEGEAKN